MTTPLYNLLDIETLRALAHMLGVKLSKLEWAMRYGGYEYEFMADARDPFGWIIGFHYLQHRAGLILPDYLANFPMSTLDEITDDAGLEAFINLLGVKIVPAQYLNMDAAYEYRGRREQFCKRDPFAHRKHLLVNLIQARLKDRS